MLISVYMLGGSGAWADAATAGKQQNPTVTTAQQQEAEAINRAEREYQGKRILKLLLGYYHGAWKVCETLNIGEIVDKPKRIDRSIVVFNNKIYQLTERNPLDAADVQRTTSLANLHSIDKPIEQELTNLRGYGALESSLETAIAGNINARFYIVQMQGEFSDIVLEKVPDKNWVQDRVDGIEKVYLAARHPRLKGTITGLRMVDYFKSNNSFVWYLHFASEDKTISGIVAGINIEKASMKLSPLNDFSLNIPIWSDDEKVKIK